MNKPAHEDQRLCISCSVEAAKYDFHVWQTAQFAVYGTCM